MDKNGVLHILYNTNWQLGTDDGQLNTYGLQSLEEIKSGDSQRSSIAVSIY